MMSLLIGAYMAFGLGMVLNIILNNDVFYTGFLESKPERELKQWEIAPFIIGFGVVWPLRFWTPINRAFILRDKTDQRFHSL